MRISKRRRMPLVFLVRQIAKQRTLRISMRQRCQRQEFRDAVREGMQRPEVAQRRERNRRAVCNFYVGTGPEGSALVLAGGKEIKAAGFLPSSVYRCARGEYSQHRGYTWREGNSDDL